MALDRTANLLGALSLVITDRTAEAMAGAGGRPESVDLLRQVLGLTSSGTVRLLDRLEEAGYVQRGPGTDGRSASITLTPAGRAAAGQVATARADVLGSALTALSPQERAVFDRLTGKMLAGLIRGPGATRWMCRLCDTGACRREEGGCPVGNAARERYRS